MADFVKLKDLVGSSFTVNEAYGYQWRKYVQNDGKWSVVTADRYEEGYSKLYDVVTDKGKLTLRQGQLQQMLEGTFSKGKSDIIGVKFDVKSNNKEGVDIRYYINKAKDQSSTPVVEENTIDMSDIPF